MLRKEAKLGDGTYGIVYKVSTPEGETFALKRNLSELDQFSSAIRELDILNRLRGHPRIITIKMITTREDLIESEINSPVKAKGMRDDVFHFLFELADSDLDNWTHANKMSFNQYKQFMIDILLGTEFIASSGIIHRDLKPSNIVVFKPGQETSTGDVSPDNTPASSVEIPDPPLLPDGYQNLHRIKICDFGLATPISQDDELTPGVYTAWYRPPEVIGGHRNYDEKADYWSVGCILYEMIFKTPFVGKCDSNNDVNIARALIRRAHYNYDNYEIREVLNYNGDTCLPNPPRTIYQQLINKPEVRSMMIAANQDYKKICKELSDIITGLLQINPSKRWTATMCLDHPFFDSHREYIQECRRTCLPRYAYQHAYDIPEVPERTHISNYITDIYNKRSDYHWYTHKRMFHAIDLFDRALRYERNKSNGNRIKSRQVGHIISKTDAELYFFCCLHISITVNGSLVQTVNIEEILPNHLSTKRHIAAIRNLQTTLLRDVFKYRIYRFTIYEAIHQARPDKDLLELCMYHSITKLTIESKTTRGLQPTELCKDILDIIDLERE